MRQEDRLGVILDRLNSHGTVGVTELAADLGVSLASVRRDLELLEDQHLLNRTHGGAVSTGVLYELRCGIAAAGTKRRSEGSPRPRPRS